MAHASSITWPATCGDIFGEMITLSRELGFKVRVLQAKR
jgi:hypothetical protein